MPNPAPQLQLEPQPQPHLARRLGLFDATMLVMGGIIGAGIFINPYVVAQRLHTPALIMGAWAAGGVIALAGAFIYAELAERLPKVGGQYAYIREAYHPLLAFLYGWVLLLVIQTGGMAAVTVTFSRYFIELTGLRLPEAAVAVTTLAVLTIVNCLGVRTGSTVQNVLMVMKIAAIFVLVAAGLFYVGAPSIAWTPISDRPVTFGLFSDFGAAMVPVLFAIAGWQTANFAAGELKNPKKDLPKGLLLGVIGVIILYLAVNFVCVRSLGANQLALTKTPASAVMSAAFGRNGAILIAFGIAVSALGFLSQSVLTAPRVYFAMAEDRVFFQAIGRISPRTQVPVFAIVLQSIWTAVILLTGKFEQILNYVVSVDFIFFGISASCLFIFRKRGVGDAQNLMPGHPWTTIAFCLVCALVVVNTVVRYPANTLIGIAILISGIPVFYLWKRLRPQ